MATQQDGGATSAIEEDDLRQLLAAGSVELRLGCGRVRVAFTALPGRTVCAAARVDGVMWIALDDGKPWCRGHAAEMLAGVPDCCAGLIGAVGKELAMMPARGAQDRLHLSLVG